MYRVRQQEAVQDAAAEEAVLVILRSDNSTKKDLQTRRRRASQPHQIEPRAREVNLIGVCRWRSWCVRHRQPEEHAFIFVFVLVPEHDMYVVFT